jgi:DNA polymerase-1
MKRLILIDAHAIIHRAYHALPPLTSPSGEPTHAVYGFTTILMRILRELKPDFIAAAFDLPGPTIRHIAYERYKAQRPETPSDLSLQFALVKNILEAFDIAVFEKEGYEADDIIGTIAKILEKRKDIEIVVVTGDLDALQLVRPRLKVYSMKKGISETVIYDEKAVRERYGFEPAQLLDFKGLKGDPSDNIPGVKGIGEKTAQELIKKFGSVEEIYKAVRSGSKKISPSVAEKLRQGAEDAKLSKELAKIQTGVPLDFDLEKIRWKANENLPEIRLIFQKLGFFSLLKRLDESGGFAPTQVELPKIKTGVTRIEKSEDLAGFKKFEKLASESNHGLILWEGELYSIFRGSDKIFRWDEKIFLTKEAHEFLESHKHFVYDGKAIIKFLRGYKIELREIVFDIMIASYLSGAFFRDFSYPAIASRELGQETGRNMPEELSHFFEIARYLEGRLALGRIGEVFEKIELPLIRILADMEERGIKVNLKFLEDISRKINEKLKKIIQEIYQLAGEQFNINSPQQLSVILFDKLKLTARGLRKTVKEGRISTGASELEKLKNAHPIVSKILEHRELMKLKTTYVDALPPLVNPKTGRIHTTFNQTGTATGRLSSSDPNLQNIPVMSELGREIRRAFVAEEGFLLVSFDYSQIELRIAAHMADDQKMIEAFRRGLDIHKMTAAEIFNVPLEMVTPEQRRAAKTLNFGILYGMGAQALAEASGMSKEEAKNFIDEYFRDFSGIRAYIDKTLQFVSENGYVETLFGRRRYIPEIHSPNWQMKREAERMAVNAPIQGSAADIAKLAMIKVDEWIKREKLENDVRLLLQVHDELLFEISEKIIPEHGRGVSARIKAIMESVAELKVPLVVDVKAGENWGEQNSF